MVYGDPADPSTYPQGDFDIVYDNNGKSMQECQALIDTYAPKVRAPAFVPAVPVRRRGGAHRVVTRPPLDTPRDRSSGKAEGLMMPRRRCLLTQRG